MMTEERINEFRNVVPLQIRFNDVDKFGHVNNTIYFQFYDSGKTDYVSTVCKGFDWNQYAIFVVKIEVEFFAQIKGEDRIAVRTRTVHLGNKSFRLEQEIFDIERADACRYWYCMTWSKSSPYRFPMNGAKPSETMTVFYKIIVIHFTISLYFWIASCIMS